MSLPDLILNFKLQRIGFYWYSLFSYYLQHPVQSAIFGVNIILQVMYIENTVHQKEIELEIEYKINTKLYTYTNI